MTYFVYILYSEKADRYYVGQSENAENRLLSHLAGISGYTSIADDWKIVHSEKFSSRGEALAREREIKKKKSRRYIEWLIKQQNVN